eukprot:scaffold1239_cov175-Pinguiococcus_pyrenoidosus.AAC.47
MPLPWESRTAQRTSPMAPRIAENAIELSAFRRASVARVPRLDVPRVQEGIRSGWQVQVHFHAVEAVAVHAVVGRMLRRRRAPSDEVLKARGFRRGLVAKGRAYNLPLEDAQKNPHLVQALEKDIEGTQAHVDGVRAVPARNALPQLLQHVGEPRG